MQLDTITLDRDQATAQLEQYEQALEHHDDPEYEAVARGLRWLRRKDTLGLIDLRRAITAGGVDELRRPRLAVVQADATWCWMTRNQDGAVTFINRDERWPADHWRRGIIRMPAGTLPISERYHQRHKAMVPLVPARLRPRRHLRNYHVLWEADWQRDPPVDPALLKHVGGDLYALLGVWDLTPLERAVLAARRDS